MPKRTVPTAEIAALHGVKPGTIRGWALKGCPCDRGKPLKFDPDEVQTWLDAQGYDGSRGRPRGPLTDELTQARAECTRALRERQELTVDAVEGRLVNRAELERAQLARITEARSALLSLPARVAHTDDPAATFRDALAAILADFAKPMEFGDVQT